MNSVKNKNFWLYSIGWLVSILGSGIQAVAIPLYILDLTDSGSAMGFFTLLSLLPALIIRPFAGVLGDKWNRKKIMVNMDLARGVIILFLAFMALTDNMSISLLFITQVFVSVMNAIFQASTGAMLPELVSSESLIKANSIVGGMNSFSMIVGPVLGGVIYGIYGIKAVFVINGASFVLSAISEMFITYTSKSKKGQKISTEVMITDIKEGIHFIGSNKGLISLLIYFAAVNFLFSPCFSVIMPYAFRKAIGFNAQQFGYLQAMFVVGMFIGNILVASLLTKASSKKLVKTGLLGMFVLNIILAIVIFPQFVSYLGGASWMLFGLISGLLIIIGTCNPMIDIPLNTSFQKMVPNEIRSRVFSVMGLVAQAGVPLGAVVYGILLDIMKVHILFFIVSIILLSVSLGFILKAPNEIYEPEKIPTLEI